MMHLSKPQKSIYNMEKFVGGSIAVICSSMLRSGTIELEVLEKAVNVLYRLNDVLRMRIIETPDGTRQNVLDYKEQRFQVLTFEKHGEFSAYAADCAKQPIDMYGPLCDVKIVFVENQYGLLVKLHHIIGDAWTMTLLAKQFAAILDGQMPEAYSYLEYLQAEESYMQSGRYQKDRKFFVEQFSKCDEATYLSEKQSDNYSADRKTITLTGEVTQQITEYAEKNKTSIFTVIMTLFGAYFSRIKMNAEKFYIGTPILNRTGRKQQATMGMFINTVPFLAEIENEKTFRENLQSAADNMMPLLRHQHYNYEELLSLLRSEYNFTNKLYDVLLSYQNAKTEAGDFRTEWYSCGMQTESLQIHIDDRDSKGILTINYDYRTDCFTEKEIEQMHKRLFCLFSDAVKNENKKICELEMLSESEKNKLLYEFNDTRVDYPKDKCVYEIFEEQVEQHPKRIAVISHNNFYTYAELDVLADSYGAKLQLLNIQKGDVVGIHINRSEDIIAFQLAVLKIGAVFLPIDKRYPKDRIEYICRESQIKILVSDELESSSNTRILRLNEFKNIKETEKIAKKYNQNICYIIYTSGSTGIPKGAQLNSKGLVNFCRNNNVLKTLKERKTNIFACVNSASFDFFIAETLLPLLNGYTTVILDDEISTNSRKFSDIMKRNDINVLMTTPTRLKLLFDNGSNREVLNQLTCICSSGEALMSDLLEVLYLKAPNAKIYNPLGPSECTVWNIGGELERGNGLDITIGSPIANTQIYILDKFNNLQPIGQIGELCIAGDGVGAGYLNQPELTAEKFVPNPFYDAGNPVMGKIMYKTGDLAYWREDGNIVYVGRNDFQVKIRGLRIELGEIENAINSVEGVLQSVVVVRKDESGRPLICAFYTEQTLVETAEIKKSIGARLPKYMMPHIFTRLDAMPLTTSGKINRKALPEVNLHIQSDVEYVAPKTEKEKILIEAVESTLHVENISVLDNFIDMGGDSLKAIELISRLENGGYSADIKTIFSCETLRALAEELKEVKQFAERMEDVEDIPATDAQMRVYTAQNMQENSTLYNVPYCFETENLDPLRLQNAVRELINRHEILRTHFEEKDGKIIQVIHETVNIEIERFNNADFSDFIRPFDLSTTPLMRIGYHENKVVVDMHHIITDGSSMPVFFHELNELYMGRELPNIPVPYKEFAIRKKEYAESEKYWLSVFDDEVPVLEVNTDFARGQKQSFKGTAYYDSIDNSLHNKINEKCKQMNITPYVFYMSGFYILLSKFSGNEDIIVGMPMIGRESRYLNTIGMFVNTIALRNKPAGTKSVREFLYEVKETSVNAIENQNYPFGELIKKLAIDIQDRNPLFDVMFAYQGEEMTNIIFGDKKATLLPVPIATSKYDLTFNLMPQSNDIVLMIEYCTDLYKESTIQRMIEGYKSILEQMLAEGNFIKDICVISETEKYKLLHAFNDMRTDYPKDKCVHQLFEEQVLKTPDKMAVIACDRTLTYDELNRLSNRIANALIEKNIGSGDIVAFALPRTGYLIAVMFGILKTGAAYLPIDPEYPEERIHYMLSDSRAKIFITEENIGDYISDKEKNPKLDITSDNLCYCIYTSGSTGNPKGTLLHHKGIVNLVIDLKLYRNIKCCKIFGFLTTITFDVATQEILTALLNGFTGCLMPERSKTSTEEITKKILECKIDIIYATPSYFDMLTLSEEWAAKLLKQLKVVVLAGEKFYLNDNVQKLRGNCKTIFENQYGPVELHVIAVAGTIDNNDFTSIGKPISNDAAYVLDKYNNLKPIGQIGELCIAGDGVGAGYLNQPELTAEKFVPNPFYDAENPVMGKIMYKTGDLAYWREDGNIVYVGRNDFQVKIRGLRIELGEIENAINSVEGVSQSIVVVRKDESGRQLICAFYTEKNPVETTEIKKSIGARLPKYMIPHIFTRLDAIPLTTSGKINRKALPEVDLHDVLNDVEYIEPATEKEKVCCFAVAKTLHIEKVGIMDNFFDLGGDSLKAIELIARLEEYGYETSVRTIFDLKTIGELAEHLGLLETEAEIVECKGDVPATPAQMRIYTAQGMQTDSTVYNVPYIFRADSVDIGRLQNAVNQMITRHESLRTYFENREGEIVQVVKKEMLYEIEQLEGDDVTAFVRPFNLSKAPLFRIGVYKNSIMIDMHHIITDGTSMSIFLRELNELYMGRTLKEEFVATYRQFAIQKRDLRESKKYWLSVFSEEPPVLELNTDFKRESKRSFCGNALYEKVDIELHNKILDKCGKLNITPYVYYMAAFCILLSKFSRNEDIVIGLPMSGRKAKFLETIGMFVNTIALRSRPEGKKTIREFLSEIRESSVRAMEHEDYPYGDLVKTLGLEIASRNPLFDVMFAYQPEKITDIVFGDKKVEIQPLPVTTAKYDFTFNVIPQKSDVMIMVEYCTDLFKEFTMYRMVKGFIQILAQMQEENKTLEELSAVLPEERQKLLYQFNETAADYPRSKCVHQIFEEQIEKTPDKIAVIACDRTLTYRQLNELSNRVAHGLMENDIKQGDIVAFALSRKSYLIATIFGILKAGAAYLPIDPDYPEERINYMLSDSRAKIFITEENIGDYISDKEENPELKITSDSLCYCIYTSGSTGRPKGVMVRHKNVVNFCCNKKTNLNDSIDRNCDCVIAANAIVFDITVQEIHLPLLNGKQIFLTEGSVLIKNEEVRKLVRLPYRLALITTPTKISGLLLQNVSASLLEKCYTIMVGAEAFSPALYQRIRQQAINAEIFNGYGPTEVTCGSSYQQINNSDITIGCPIANTQIYILDKYNNPKPIGQVGELCIAGDGVGAGYLNRPELTAEKFVPNPFYDAGNPVMGEVMYKTGDLAYWREDGNIVYVGRNDFQVKIRGLRIELGEIENAINSVEGVSQSIVVVRKDESGRQLICAFYTEKNPVETTEIKKSIGARLPKYMIPHIFTRLGGMPLTTSGKINRKALPEVDLNEIDNAAEYERPVGETEKRLVALMEEVLHYAPIGRNENFFDIGGDSLRAIEFVSKAHNEGIYFSLQSVFDNPTVKELCAYIEKGDKTTAQYTVEDFSKYEALLSGNVMDENFQPNKCLIKSVFLTGATGFLGSHILDCFMEGSEAKIYCLVRGSEKRLQDTLWYYFGEKYKGSKRIIPVEGDFESLKDIEIEGGIDFVIHAGASVKHYGSYSYFYEKNVVGTRNVLDFAKRHNAKVIHVSTLSVSGNIVADSFDVFRSEEELFFSESSLYIGQPLDNVYARSKFEAEKAVLDAMLDGQEANIIRVGNLTNRYCDGKFQPNYKENAFAKRVKAVLEFGTIPDYLLPLYCEFSPTDATARTIFEIVRHFNTQYTVFHCNSNKEVYFDKLIEYLHMLNIKMDVVSAEEFVKRLNTKGMEYVQEALINDMDENSRLLYDTNIRILNDFTVNYLMQLGFEWPEIGFAYVEQYVNYFKEIGYLEV